MAIHLPNPETRIVRAVYRTGTLAAIRAVPVTRPPAAFVVIDHWTFGWTGERYVEIARRMEPCPARH